MKTILSISLFLISNSLMAQRHTYDCKLMTDYSVSEEIVVTPKTMTILTKVPGRRSLREVFDNNGLKGGNGKMKDRLSFIKNYQESDIKDGDIVEFLLTPDMLQGGSLLRNGSRGGFVSFAGHGYSWETYICFKLRDRDYNF